MTTFSVDPHPDPKYSTWYVKEPAPFPGLSPHVVAICTNQVDAQRVAAALAALDAQQQSKAYTPQSDKEL